MVGGFNYQARMREPEHNAFGKPPELERESYDGIINYLEHGYPSSRVRWHCHDEYELHLIVATSGKLFVGDYIGEFSPGHLVLTGPRLPHNWISSSVPDGGVPLRDMIVQFAHEPLAQAAKCIPELRELLPLLERSTYGVEFFDCGAEAEQHLLRIRAMHGAERFAEFVQFMSKLARTANYRLLSSATMRSFDDDATLAKVNAVLTYITENYREQISAEMLAEQLGMSLSKFSRFFRKATGNSFTDFVSRLRINKACQLLMNTDQYVTNVCYDVGFHNVANFNRRFLQVKGVTPKEFRRQADGRFGGPAAESGSPSAV
ncbi:helix-turn-helix domain-containing protein [Janthinobacterium agaricidamnosum]